MHAKLMATCLVVGQVCDPRVCTCPYQFSVATQLVHRTCTPLASYALGTVTREPRCMRLQRIAVLQGVHMLFEGSPERMWRENEERVSKMVFIGKDLDFVALKEGFEDCACDPVGAVAEPVGTVTVM